MKANSVEAKVIKILDEAVRSVKDHPIRSAFVALIVVWIIKNLIEAVRG